MILMQYRQVGLLPRDRFVPRRNAFMERVREKAFLAPLLCAILLQRDFMFRMLLYYYDK